MKFKFLVDGVWRVDERQPISKDEFGVNNVVMVEPQELMPQLFPIVDDSLPIMEIDELRNRNHADGVSNFETFYCILFRGSSFSPFNYEWVDLGYELSLTGQMGYIK